MITNLSAKLAKGSFFYNVLLLAGGTTLGQGITILTLPLLTRIYSPDAMGKFGLVISFISVASVAGCLLYEAAIVSAKSDVDAAYLTCISFLLALITTFVSTALFYSFISFKFFGFGRLELNTSFWIPIMLFLGVVLQPLKYLLIRNNSFKLLSKVGIFQNLIRATSQIGLGLIYPNVSELLAGDILGRFCGIGRIFQQSWKIVSKEIFPFNYKLILSTLSFYKDFPKYSLLSSVLDVIACSLILPVITELYGIKEAGFFLLAQRTISIPMVLIGSSVADAFHNKITTYSYSEPNKVYPFFLRTAKNLLILGLLPSISLSLVCPFTFGWIFGQNWTDAGILVAIISPWSLAGLISSPLSRIVFVLDGQKTKLFYDVFSLTSQILSFYICSLFSLSMLQCVTLFSIVGIIGNIFYFFLLWRIAYRFSLKESNVIFPE